MSSGRDAFPLVTGIGRLIGGQIADIVAGRPVELLEQVTPVTAELLRYWFEADYCDLRQLNFHEGQ